jgi:hypothetical protein
MEQSKQQGMYRPQRQRYVALTSFLKAHIAPWLIAGMFAAVLIYLATVAPTIT